MRYLSKTSLKKLRGVALLRLDFNTQDEWRMRAVLPSVKLLLRAGAKILILSHRGRPAHVQILKGIPRKFEKKFSLKKDAVTLGKMLNRNVVFIPHFRFEKIEKQIRTSPAGTIFLLENIRFLKSENTPAPELARRLAALGDYFVNDAFAASHRESDSVAKVERFLPSYAGLELEKEIKVLSRVMRRPRRPLIVVIGGAKAHDKLGIIKFFRRQADAFLLGGAAANTMLYLRGENVGQSLRDKDPTNLRRLKQILKYKNLFLPLDWKMEKNAILDIGPETARLYVQKLKAARTIIWAGPMGYIEKKKFVWGSLAVARAIAGNKGAFSITGGGETVMFLKKYHLDKKFSFISTGGGAMLQFLAGKKLPGIAALDKSR
jgi:phosphoglycerate kinase